MLSTKIFEEFAPAKAYIKARGSFGEITGDIERQDGALFAEADGCKVTCRYECDEYGIISRKDSVENVSDAEISVTALKSRFVFDGGEYEIYTQYNNWQSESMGGWEPLVAGVTVECSSLRTAQNAATRL